MKASTLFITAISIATPNWCLAEPNAKSFSFKETRFGDSWPPEKGNDQTALEPWKRDWGNIAKAHPYPRIQERDEKDERRLRFGERPLSSINYKYLDKKLFEIHASFNPTIGCGWAGEIVRMLEIRYAINFEEKYEKINENFIGTFANQSISIDVKCARSIFSLYEEKDNGERTTSVTFREKKGYKHSQEHIMDTLNRRSQDLREAGDRKIKSKIDF